MTPRDRKILEDFWREHHKSLEIIAVQAAVRAALDEIDTMNPPMPIDQYPPEERRKLAREILNALNENPD